MDRTLADLKSFEVALAKLAIATNRSKAVDAAEFDVFFEDLMDIPTPLILAALADMRQDRRYFPGVADIRERVDEILDRGLPEPLRRQIDGPTMQKQLLPGSAEYNPVCATCNDTGWRDVPGPDGVLRSERCKAPLGRLGACWPNNPVLGYGKPPSQRRYSRRRTE